MTPLDDPNDRPKLGERMEERSATGTILEPCLAEPPDGNWLWFGARDIREFFGFSFPPTYDFPDRVTEGGTLVIPVTIAAPFCDDQVFVVSAREVPPDDQALCRQLRDRRQRGHG